MSYLRHFPIDTLKIDRVFVRDITSRRAGNAPLVDAIIAMSKSLGLATVAEGVETETQWQYLKDCDATQVQASCSVGRCRSWIWSAGMPIGCCRAGNGTRGRLRILPRHPARRTTWNWTRAQERCWRDPRCVPRSIKWAVASYPLEAPWGRLLGP